MVYFRKTRDAVSKLTTPGHIYFIQAESGGLVKIGWATCPKTRMARMQAHGPLKLVLLHSEPGNGKNPVAGAGGGSMGDQRPGRARLPATVEPDAAACFHPGGAAGCGQGAGIAISRIDG